MDRNTWFSPSRAGIFPRVNTATRGRRTRRETDLADGNATNPVIDLATKRHQRTGCSTQIDRCLIWFDMAQYRVTEFCAKSAILHSRLPLKKDH
jgi:hypothetical protein